MKILVTGDFVINRKYGSHNINDSVISLFENTDLSIVNLEAPVTTSSSKITKTGPHLNADKKSTESVLNALGIDVVTLANNHILDYDQQGVCETLDFCIKNNIKTVGAGENLNKASDTLYLNTEEGVIAIINFAENEWASATAKRAGANPMNVIDNSYQIKEAKSKSDFVIVIVHGGHEYYNLPSPRMQKQYRFYVEQGADIIVGHHTHCISGYEVYKGAPIYYSLGNFLFTENASYSDWYIGLILQIEIKDGELSTVIHPVMQERETFELNLMQNEKKRNVFSRIKAYNSVISNSTQLEKEWKRYVDLKSDVYLSMWSPISFIPSRYLRGILRRLPSPFKFINKKGMALYLNLIRCEAHRDLSKEVIANILKDESRYKSPEG